MYQGENFNNHEELLETGDVRLGLVANCKKLNVRESPALDAPIICEIVCQTKLMVEEVDSTEDFYKVCTAAGIEGFCMKKFIAIQP